ncbi:unnamed protein product [Diabrotica balteata]|uniref:receptor protein-tyrosine kinase n=1 Tax=Diabrotica balteata TaxID=107213 RepID=A0A9N9SVZ0_DIABA|nr:unnamed protein product [Diabrotica balteata]
MRLSVILVFAIFSALVGALEDLQHSDKSCRECNKESLKYPRCMQNKCDCRKPPKRDQVTLNSELGDNNITDVEIPSTIINTTTLLQSFVNPPRLHCKETDFLILLWTLPDEVDYYFVRFSTVGMNVVIRETPLRRCRYVALMDMQPDTLYSIELHGFIFNPNRQTQRVQSRPILIRTRKEGITPRSINNFWLSKFEFKDKKYTANVQWTGGRDPPCFYKITYFSPMGDYEEVNIDPFELDYTWAIPNLIVESNYQIALTPYTSPDDFPVLEGKKTWLNITTPSCIETFHSTNKCVPEDPEDIMVVENVLGNLRSVIHYNVTVKWKEPKYPPSSYMISILFINTENPYILVSHNISGDHTNFTFFDVALPSNYGVSLIAYSARGASKPAYIERHTVVKINESEQVLDPPPKVSNNLTVIIAPVAALIVLLMITATIFIILRIKKREKSFEDSNNKFIPGNLNTAIIIPMKADEWEIDVNKLTIKEVLGNGAFGVVRKGWYMKTKEKEIEVAIKMLRENPTSEEIQQFQQEIQLMKAVPVHPNLVSMIGCVTQGQLLLVVEYCPKGDLQTYLRVAADKMLKANLIKGNDYVEKSVFNKMYEFDQLDLDDIPQPKDLISFARQVTLGMEFLSSYKLIHRDLAARNVLITDDNKVKISDFGLSRDVYYNNMYCKSSGGKLPIRWMALESMTHQMYTTHSDVWSFGILLWEITTLGGTPYPGIPTQDIMGMLKKGYRMAKPDNCSDELYVIMCKCWIEKPTSRPSFTELKKNLDDILSSFTEYLVLDPSLAYKYKDFTVKEDNIKR